MTSTNDVLCATDFSPCSIDALRYAIATAQRLGGRVHLVHAWQLPVVPAADGAEVIGLEAIERLERALARKLEDLAAAHRASGLVIGTRLVMGDPARAVVSLAAELGCATIVLGTHGRSGLPRVVLGSVAERVVRTARCRVIVVPPREEAARSYADRPVRRVVCPIDFSAGSEAALGEAVALAERSEATVTVLHAFALSALADPGSALAKGFERQLATDLEGAARRYSGRGARLETALRAGTAWEVITETARELDADLVVVGTEGRTGMSRFLLGSTAEKVVRTSPVPVMVVPRHERS